MQKGEQVTAHFSLVSGKAMVKADVGNKKQKSLALVTHLPFLHLLHSLPSHQQQRDGEGV